ncbi:MAG: hypothetical protein E5W03_14390, partial [Mesorhizobium sp.]
MHGRPQTVDGKILKPMQNYGLKVMSMGFLVDEETPMIWRGPMVMSALTQMLREVEWGPLDVLVVDMPPGTGDAQLTMAQQVPLAGAVIVSTPQDLALIDARKGLNMFKKVDVPLLGIVDTAVVGQFGDAALLGGLAAGSLVFDVVFTTFNFLRSGTTGLVAQAFGRGDALEEQAVLWRALLIAVVAGVILAALSPLFAVAGQWFIGAEPRVSAAMSVYIRIRLLAAPFSLINYAILGYVLGRGEGGLGLMLQAVLNGINIVLCFLLGLELGWGVAGVA